MLIAALRHFRDYGLVPFIQSPEFPDPPESLRVPRIAAFTLVFRKNVPKPVKLAMFSE